jgi:multisubunit Na+/H+ antiporter MnhG subunit
MAITAIYIFALLVPIVLGYLIYRAIKKDEIKNREIVSKYENKSSKP